MYQWLRSMLFQMDPESAHTLTLRTLSKLPSAGRLMAKPIPASDSLQQTLWGLSFPHPIGLAAGLDKNGEAVDAFLQIGFSFVEVGTVTPKAQPGNPKPRLFRLTQDDALINRMGFNNDGAEALAAKLSHRRTPGLVGINIGKNKLTSNDDAVSDYVRLVKDLYNWADFFVVNVSSPNTPGLRDLQAADTLVPLVKAILEERTHQSRRSFRPTQENARPIPPVLVKLAPDLDDDTIVEVAARLEEIGVDGFIATNTTITRPGLQSRYQNETGGLSGRPLKTRSTAVLSLVYEACEGRVPVIASGGVFSADDAYEKIRAGASLVELYTAFIYKGPLVIAEIVQGLADRLARDGFKSIDEAIGSRHRF